MPNPPPRKATLQKKSKKTLDESWFPKTKREPARWAKAQRHLGRVDPILAAMIKRTGPCKMEPRKDYFVALCKSIFSQQLSTTIAATLFGRFRDQFPKRRPTPALTVAGLSEGGWPEEVVRHIGLSRQKRAYVLDLAKHFVNGELPTRSFAGMTDEEIIEHLTRVKGIGRWTAEMFLMFVLNREDLLPVDDLGIMEGARHHFKLPQRPSRAELIALGEKWRPYRSVASWYLWRAPKE